MNRYIVIKGLGFVVGLVLAAAVVNAAGLEEKVVEHRLSNGLQLLIVERPETPVVTAYITIGVGAVDETSETRGVAHLLEHMLFKGTKTLGTTDYAKEKPLLDQIELVGSELDRLKIDSRSDPVRVSQLEQQLAELQSEHKQFVVKDEFSRIYSENGGVGYNAFTSKDLTTYLVSLPANKLELWALVESDRMKNPVLREFYTERDVIREERRRSYETSPRGLLYETLIANAYTVHPYRDPIIG
ncbi:MAG: insulinase family protein, partial [Desulfuromonas sp.]